MDLKIENLRAGIKNVEEKLGEKIASVRDRPSRIEGQLVPAKVITFEEARPQGTPRGRHSKSVQAQ